MNNNIWKPKQQHKRNQTTHNTNGDKQQCKRTNTRGAKQTNRTQLKNSQNFNP
jgi:hypothetical protein